MGKFAKTKIERPTQKDALEFIKEGFYHVGSDKFVSSSERVRELEKLSRNIQEFLKNQIPKSKNLDLVILKCHLLIEYMMDQLINLFSKHKIDITKERFTFYQKISLLHILGFPADPTILPSIEIINKLRNQVAHTLSIDRGLIDTLLKINCEDPDSFRTPNDNERAGGIKSITKFICGALMGIIEAHHVDAYEETLSTESGGKGTG